MADWIDTLSDAIFQIAQPFMDPKRPKRLIGVSCLALTAFGVTGTLIAVALGTKLAAIGYLLVIPLLLTTTAIACYCFLTDNDQANS